jgi:hypothetical protein
MASRKTTRSEKKTIASTKAKPAAKKAVAAANAKPTAKEAAPAAAKAGPVAGKPAPAAPTKPAPPFTRKPGGPTAPTSRAEYLQAGLEGLVRHVRLRDQAEAKRLEPAIAHLAKAYGKLLGKA